MTKKEKYTKTEIELYLTLVKYNKLSKNLFGAIGDYVYSEKNIGSLRENDDFIKIANGVLDISELGEKIKIPKKFFILEGLEDG